MIPYFINFAVLSILSLFQLDQYGVLYRQFLLFIAMFGLTVFSGIRSSNVGADYNNYKEMFYEFQGAFDGSISQIFEFDQYFFEPGFAVFIVFVKTFTSSHV